MSGKLAGISGEIDTNTSIGYPELEGDEARRAIWIHDVSLASTHQLRNTLNNSKVDYREVLPKYEIPVIARVLKLYLLELPGSFSIVDSLKIIKLTRR